MTEPRLVPDSGSPQATILIVGESPGKQEHIKLQPFVGASGYKLNDFLAAQGFERTDTYITNVYPYYPKAQGYSVTGSVPIGELREWAWKLHERIEALPNLRVIVPMGNLAINALFGSSLKDASITKFRGSVLWYGGVPVVPTWHPAFLMRSPEREADSVLDWAKIRKVYDGDRQEVLQRKIFVWGQTLGWEGAYDRALRAPTLTVDIETLPNDGVIDIVGFASSPLEAIIIPTWFPDYAECPEKLDEAWVAVRALCEAPSNKIWQAPGFYDPYWLDRVAGIKLNGVWDNTYWMHHALDPLSKHDLAFLASIYTNEPYWKDESKGERQARLIYCGKDCCTEFEIYEILKRLLEESGQWWVYDTYYQGLAQPAYQTQCHGIDMDTEQRKAALSAATARLKEIGEALAELAGVKLTGPKGALSAKKLQAFLYDKCGLPKQTKYAKGERRTTTDEVALRTLFLTHRGKAIEADTAIPLIIEHRLLDKRRSTFLGSKVQDKDGRCRTDYNFRPYTGRLSAKTTPTQTGTNHQNIPRKLRHLFKPDEGCVFLEVDLSTAEDRVVKMLTRDPRMIELARTHPSEFDQHRYNAATLLAKLEADVTGDERYTLKRVGHGSNYGMGAKTLSETFLKDEIIKTIEECAQLKTMYVDRCMPCLPAWHASVRQEVMRYRKMTNTWGRTVYFEYKRLDDDVYTDAYAFRPQSEVGVLMNQYGFIPFFHWAGRATAAGYYVKINLQLHDSLLVSVDPRYVWDAASVLQQMLERPRMYYGQALTIPCTFKVGVRWGGGKEWKVLPKRDEMVEYAMEALCEK